MNWKKLGVEIVKSLESTLNVNIFERIIKTWFLTLNLGIIKKIKINSAEKKIECTILLKGEQQDIEILIDNYSLLKSEEGIVVVLNQISISRKWINTLANKYLVGKQILLSGNAKDFAEILK